MTMRNKPVRLGLCIRVPDPKLCGDDWLAAPLPRLHLSYITQIGGVERQDPPLRSSLFYHCRFFLVFLSLLLSVVQQLRHDCNH